MADNLSQYIQEISRWRDEGLSLRAIAGRLAEIGGPVVDPKTIAARLRKPVQSLEHISEQIRSLAVPIGTLQLDRRNARRHPENNLTAIKGSLQEFGQMKPIVANVRSGKPVVIAGNGTLEAALGLGWTHIAVITVNVSEATAAAFALADNRTAELAEWDAQTLAAILMELEQDDVDMSALGFDDEFVKGVLAEANPPGDDPDPPDDNPAPIDKAAELQKTWQTARGQVWEIPSKSVPGKCHRVMCGDCREPADVESLLDGQKVNVAFTSPPYASQRKYDEESGFKPIHPDAYVEWFEAVQANVRQHLAPDGSWFVNIKEHCEDGQRHLYVKDLTIAHVRQWGWLYKDELVWDRGSFPGEFQDRFKNGWEPVFHFSAASKIRFRPMTVAKTGLAMVYSTEKRIALGDKGGGFSAGSEKQETECGLVRPSNVVRIDAGGDGTHSAAFPVPLPSWFIKAYSDPGDVIFDPFMGSGTTLIAAEREGRIGYGMELSPKYLAVILERAKNAGLEPRLV